MFICSSSTAASAAAGKVCLLLEKAFFLSVG